MEPSSPTVWRRWIATEMRRLRERSGRSQADAADFLGCQVPKISLIEGGQRNIRDPDLTMLLTLYQVPEGDWDYFLTAAKRSREKGWWETYDSATLPAAFVHYLGLEQGAEQIRTYHPAIFNGLLQTPDYAAAVLKNSTKGLSSPEWVHRSVALRRRRQSALWRDQDPLNLVAVVDESALHRAIGGPEVMRTQIEHVVDVADRYPNITVQLIPFDRGVFSIEFSIFSFPWRDDPGVVYLEHHEGGTYLETLAELDAFSYAFEQLRSVSLPPEESAEILLQTATTYAS